MKTNYKLMVYVVGLIPLLITTQAQATIYKCVNLQAEVYYNDKPCPVTNIERKIRSVKDPEGGYIPPEFVADQVKSASPGIVVGNESGRKLDQSNKDQSDNSSNASSSGGGSSSGTSANSSDSSSNSSGSSDYASNSQSESDYTNHDSSNSKRATKKNVIHKERDYKPESDSKYDD